MRRTDRAGGTDRVLSQVSTYVNGVNNRCKSTNEETRDFLNLIYEQNITTILDSKNLRNAIIYQELVKEMTNKGYDKPWDVLQSKWKALKQRYRSQKKSCLENKRQVAPF